MLNLKLSVHTHLKFIMPCLFSEFMNSSILNSGDYYFRHLGNFLENAVGDISHWLLWWRATLHGWSVSQFHSH